MKTLYIVATPIGNLADMTKRGVDALNSVDLIACEDTRHTKILLDHYDIKTPTVSYHQYSSLQKIDWLVGELIRGKDVALVTDAGTPGISDPGGVLVAKIHLYNREHDNKISINSIPGPSAVTAALSVCGFPADSFLFLGFLPKKKGRQTLLGKLAGLDSSLVETVVFYESAQRINRTLFNLRQVLPVDNPICLCRELTKKFEEIWRGNLEEAIEKTKNPQKGEFVVVFRLIKQNKGHDS